MPVGISMHEFTALTSLPVGATRLVTVGIDFGDSTQNVSCDLVASGRPIKINFRPPVGELIRPVTCTEGVFINEQGIYRDFSMSKQKSSKCTNLSI